MLPMANGKRRYVPGSLPIVDKLGNWGLLEVYEAAVFTRGPPRCSYCVGLSAEKAEKGETWLSSQNRNFKDRMGAGTGPLPPLCLTGNANTFRLLRQPLLHHSLRSLPFSFTITDLAPFIAEMDLDFFANRYRPSASSSPASALRCTEPEFQAYKSHSSALTLSSAKPTFKPKSSFPTIKSHIITLGNLIDTDILSPGSTLGVCTTDAEFGEHCLEHTHPDFRQKMQSAPCNGSAIVVASNDFGVRSSRESTVSTLKG